MMHDKGHYQCIQRAESSPPVHSSMKIVRSFGALVVFIHHFYRSGFTMNCKKQGAVSSASVPVLEHLEN